MKKLIIAALLMTGMASFAQEQQHEKKQRMEQLSPEQRNELRLKKLTLELNLNSAQQKEMSKLIAEQSAKREAVKAERKAKAQNSEKEKITADQRFALQSKMLDEKIAYKEKVKKILTPEQFEKWEKLSARKQGKMKAHMGKRKAIHDKKK